MILSGKHLVYQFTITLKDSEPLIWRKIQILSTKTFWDFHVAIQDSMGWLDYHMHEFRIKRNSARKLTYIGLPTGDKDMEPPGLMAGWNTQLSMILHSPGQEFIYNYDFGDDWNHIIRFDGILAKEDDTKYPMCLSGENACPPEDCGGIHGYMENIMDALKDPSNPENEDIITWLGPDFDPYQFNRDEVVFSNAKRRLNRLLKR